MSGGWRWYVARLAAMSPAEILHRLHELGGKRRLARLQGGWRTFEGAQSFSLKPLPALRRRLAQATPGMVDEVLRGARFLGHDGGAMFRDGDCPEAADWFADPVSGQAWPGAEASGFSVDVRSTSSMPSAARPHGDVKFIWEPNRLQVLQPLACIIAGEGEEAGRARLVALAILKSWMAANPPYRGVNWVSGIELGLRLVSITLLSAALDHATLERDDARRLKAFVAAHAEMLATLPSLHSSANNHRIAEGLGLYLAGLLAPDLDAKHGYRTQGREILESETSKQIYSDGVGAEQSPSYQAFTMELIAFAALLADDEGQAFAAPVQERLLQGARFLVRLQYPDGCVPAIGDDDEGRVLLCPHRDEPLYVASVAASVAALCGSAGEIGGVYPGYLRETIFGVDRVTKDLATQPSLSIHREGGYSILRRNIAGRDIHLVFDHGPLGYLSLAAHGHADALSIWLAVDGQPVFVDAGTWLYHSGEAARHRLRQSQSHNTLSLQNMSQSEPSAAFSWANKANAALCEPDMALTRGESEWAMAGMHDGYMARAGVVHRRDILGRPGGFVVADRLSGGDAPVAVELGFLCHPALAVDIADNRAMVYKTVDGVRTFVLALTAPEGFSVSEKRTGQGAHAGYSPRFGETNDTARILLNGTLAQQPCLTLIDFETS